MPQLGQCEITAARWIGAFDLAVAFVSNHPSKLIQLYVGRTLSGVSESPGDGQIVAIVQPSLYPQHLTLLAVDPADKQTDFGADLPPRPFNRVKIGFSTSGWPADAKLILLTSGSVPDEAPQADQELLRIPVDIPRTYTVVSPPMPGTGDWQFRLTGQDAVGNAGDHEEFTQHVYAHPPDVAFNDDGTRFAAQAVGGVLNVQFAL